MPRYNQGSRSTQPNYLDQYRAYLAQYEAAQSGEVPPNQRAPRGPEPPAGEYRGGRPSGGYGPTGPRNPEGNNGTYNPGPNADPGRGDMGRNPPPSGTDRGGNGDGFNPLDEYDETKEEWENNGSKVQPDPWTPDMSQLDWLVAQQQRRNPFREAMRIARSSNYGDQFQRAAAMRGAGGGQLGAISAVIARDTNARITGSALDAEGGIQGQRDSAIGQLLGTKYGIQMQGMQLQSQDELTRLQLEQMGQQYDQTRSDNKRNAWMQVAGGLLGTGIGLLAGNPLAGFTIGSGVGNAASGRMSYAPPNNAQTGPMSVNAGGVGLDYSYGGTPSYTSSYSPRMQNPVDQLAQGMSYASPYSNDQLTNFLPLSGSTAAWKNRYR